MKTIFQSRQVKVDDISLEAEESTYVVQCIRSLSEASLDLEALDDESVAHNFIFKPVVEIARKLLVKSKVSKDTDWITVF